MEVLTAFVREHSPLVQADVDTSALSTRSDVQAAVTVIGRRDRRYDHQPVNLTAVALVSADLAEADLTGAILAGADLTGANLIGANLTRADLTGVDLTSADFRHTDLTGAIWPVDVAAPGGWQRDTASSRLERADTNSGRSGGKPELLSAQIRAALERRSCRSALKDKPKGHHREPSQVYLTGMGAGV